jgi:hypothetical protein
MGRAHAEILSACVAGAELVAVSDPDVSRAEVIVH